MTQGALDINPSIQEQRPRHSVVRGGFSPLCRGERQVTVRVGAKPSGAPFCPKVAVAVWGVALRTAPYSRGASALTTRRMASSELKGLTSVAFSVLGVAAKRGCVGSAGVGVLAGTKMGVALTRTTVSGNQMSNSV